MKRMVSLFLSISFLLIALPLGAMTVSAATSGTTGDCTWTLDDNGHLTISGNGKMGNNTWFLCGPWGADILSVTIEEGVTAIGESSFYDCTSLTSVTIPNSITTIGQWAFYGCQSLQSVSIPNGITIIENNAFTNCASLTAVTIPNSVTIIGHFAFYNCTSLTTITIPKSVTTVLSGAFDGCNSLVDVCYSGNKEDCARINIDSDNHFLLNATWHYANSKNHYGDLNGDGQISLLDLALFQRYLNGWDVAVDTFSADVTNDGKVNTIDLALLQRYLNGWDVQLGTQ